MLDKVLEFFSDKIKLYENICSSLEKLKGASYESYSDFEKIPSQEHRELIMKNNELYKILSFREDINFVKEKEYFSIFSKILSKTRDELKSVDKKMINSLHALSQLYLNRQIYSYFEKNNMVKSKLVPSLISPKGSFKCANIQYYCNNDELMETINQELQSVKEGIDNLFK